MPTLRQEIKAAHAIGLCTFKNPKNLLNGIGGENDNPSTECHLHEVLKAHPLIAKNSVVTLKRYIPSTKRFLVFFDVHKNQLDAYKGIEIESPDMVKYFKEIQALDGKDRKKALAFFFQYLGHKDNEIALDTYRELSQASHLELRQAAPLFDAKKLVAWLRDPKTPTYRHGLYATLLGLCGKPEHAKVLRALIDDPELGASSGLEGFHAGYVLLKPKEAWTYLSGILKNSDQAAFAKRYTALRTCRFLYNDRPDLIDKSAVIQGIAQLLDQNDMADFAIEDFRRWQRWEMTTRVVDLFGKPGFEQIGVKRAILRFALRSPEMHAIAFVARQRMADPEWVKDTEDLLRLEDTPAKKEST